MSKYWILKIGVLGLALFVVVWIMKELNSGAVVPLDAVTGPIPAKVITHPPNTAPNSSGH